MRALKLLQRDPSRPTLRERAAALRASAGRVMSPAAPLPAPDSDEEAEPLDWHNPPGGFMAYPSFEPEGFLKIVDALPLEADRLLGIAQAEFERRSKAIRDRDGRLDRAEEIAALRRVLRVDAWTAVASGEAERAEPAGDDRSEPGFVLYEDAGGRVRRAPITDWIGFMALRLYSVAKRELDRGFNAACASEPDQDANALYDRLRLNLRIDALHDLAFFSQTVSEASRDYAVGARRQYQRDNTALAALGRELDAAHAAWREAAEANREPHSRYAAYLTAAKAKGGPSMQDCRAASALPGVAEASDAEEKAFDAVGELSLAALKLPARTLADLAVQARAVIPHVWATGLYEKDGAPNADENIDKEAVRSLIESCCAAAGVDWRGVSVGEASATELVDTDRRNQQEPLGDLLSGLDLPAMPMRTLSALHEHVETLNTICYGLAAQPRSLNRDRMLNEAGIVMYRLTEGLLQRASNACLSEARRRASATGDDRDIRLAMLARAIIENDDHDEIRAFARDLLVMTEA